MNETYTELCLSWLGRELNIDLEGIIFVLCNISAMCTVMTKTYDIMIGLRQLLCMCKAEKTQLNEMAAIGVFCVQRTVADKVQKIGT